MKNRILFDYDKLFDVELDQCHKCKPCDYGNYVTQLVTSSYNKPLLQPE